MDYSGISKILFVLFMSEIRIWETKMKQQIDQKMHTDYLSDIHNNFELTNDI